MNQDFQNSPLNGKLVLFDLTRAILDLENTGGGGGGEESVLGSWKEAL